jgi:ABC-type phosphate transport system substrate-binding protein
MSRYHLLGAASAVALACLSTGAFAQESTTAITGGGSTLAEFDYFQEFSIFNAAQAAGAAIFDNTDGATTADQSLYWASGSTAGQASFLQDQLSCDATKVLSTEVCGTVVGGANSVDYGASDAVLSASQISGWATSAVGQSVAGDLIQLPSMGVGIAIPVVNSKLVANGGITLTDNDLCGIFSGKITNWNQTSAYGTGKMAGTTLAAGAITVVYRSDGSGTSFLLLNHFSSACTTTNSNFKFPITPSTTFTTVFTSAGATVPANFVGESGSQGVAGELSGLNGAVTSAIGYISPDFTDLYYSTTNAVLSNGAKSKLYVAAVKATGAGTAYTPTLANITSGLNHVTKVNTTLGGPTTAPATAAEGANPQNWVPLPIAVSTGYPIVGYTTFDFAQCYASAKIAAGIESFLKGHYTATTSYATQMANNGFVTIAESGAKTFPLAILNHIVQNVGTTKTAWNININNATTCKGKTGR